MLEVCMTRELEKGPQANVRLGGYSVRWYHPGDRELWQGLQADTGIYDPVPPDLFEREFGGALAQLPDRMCFVEDRTGQAVGTATCWLPQAGRDPGEGRLHWLAVSPLHQRKGLGRYLTATACARMRKLGATSVYLTTGSGNVPAIRLYLGLGFRPQVRTKTERAAWDALRNLLAPRFAAQLSELTQSHRRGQP